MDWDELNDINEETIKTSNRIIVTSIISIVLSLVGIAISLCIIFGK